MEKANGMLRADDRKQERKDEWKNDEDDAQGRQNEDDAKEQKDTRMDERSEMEKANGMLRADGGKWATRSRIRGARFGLMIVMKPMATMIPRYGTAQYAVLRFWLLLQNLG